MMEQPMMHAQMIDSAFSTSQYRQAAIYSTLYNHSQQQQQQSLIFPQQLFPNPTNDINKTNIRRIKKIESIKKHFTKEEDEVLKYLVSVFGENSWSLVSQYMPGRQSRQCRERYIGYLNPSLVSHPWTETEDELLIQKYEELGPRWVKFVPFFPGRSDSSSWKDIHS